MKQVPWLPAILTALLLASGALGSACGKPARGFDPEAVINGKCQAAQDQRLSFMAKVDGFPVRLLVDSEFTVAQAAIVHQIAARWNVLGRQLVGTDFFDVRHARLGDDARGKRQTDCSSAYGGGDVLTLVREQSQETWTEMKFTADTPGVTLRCFSTDDNLVTRQTTMIYTPVIDDFQFGSVVSHELGHSLGLNHSCSQEEASNPKYRSCSGLGEGHPYRAALMFPTIRKVAGNRAMSEIKESLRANDVQRAGCLY